ncbi:CLASP1 [Cordylochernes scorpioides]|uniref:CLASP1 n=1 Tax=Cordylochernes scorpioides TaxID=51811 RepID=A0ABY6LP17_9ARAC|nr:CLASP1 [Cordylochernes scorpioides]
MNSLKRTADEIQRYHSDLEADSVDCRNNRSYHDHRLEGEPTHYSSVMRGVLQEVRNGYHPPLEEEATNGGSSSNGEEEGLTAAVEELKAQDASPEQRKKALSNLVTLAKQGLPDLWDQYFRHVLCLVIETASSGSEGSVRTMALRTLCELIKHQPQHFQDYVELTILKVLEASKDEDKDVLRAAEMCAGVAANMLPPEQTARTLKPIIMTGEYPVNLAAIKMFTKLVEQQGNPVVQQLLPDIIPAVIKAYDSLHSSVRKAAVFCMVALHTVVGDGLFPHLKSLNGSKVQYLYPWCGHDIISMVSLTQQQIFVPILSQFVPISSVNWEYQLMGELTIGL